jgi:hypothetical protein
MEVRRLLKAALDEPQISRSKLDPYAGVIAILRQRKKWDFRRIAAWLRQKGCSVSHGWLSEWYKNRKPKVSFEPAESGSTKSFVVPLTARIKETPDLSLKDPEDL